MSTDPLTVEVENRNRPARALVLLREWWRLHLLSQSGASSHADYLAYLELLNQVRVLLAEETPGSTLPTLSTMASLLEKVTEYASTYETGGDELAERLAIIKRAEDVLAELRQMGAL